MHKIVFIDDDAIILRGMSQTIPWEVEGFQLAGTARDGETGLVLIERERPQVVITDIRMPFMDGIQLTEHVKQQFPDIKIIMMTSYDEFEYAQKALQLKVFDFVLKPVEKDVLLQTVRRASDEWEKDQTILKKAIPMLRQRFLDHLIHGRIKHDEIEAELEFLQLPLQAAHYVVVVLKADEYFDPDHKNRFGQELLKYCIQNVVGEIVEPLNGIAFDADEDETILIYQSNSEAASASKEAYGIAEQIRHHVETFLKTTVTVGVGTVASTKRDIAVSYRDAFAATEIRHLIGTNRVLTLQDTGLRSDLKPLSITHWRDHSLSLKVRLGLKNEALSIIRQIESEVTASGTVSLERLRLLCMEITFGVVNAFPESEEVPYHDEDFRSLLQELHQYRTAKDMFARIYRFVSDLTAVIENRRNHQQKDLVRRATEFIQNNFAREGLSLQEVADEIHISPTYLSIIFKKEKGINFVDFLFETRMKEAMRLLLMEDLKTYEVAERVGYANPQYFSVSFKKYTGVSPTEFKQSNKAT